jgi:hypothetical protein
MPASPGPSLLTTGFINESWQITILKTFRSSIPRADEYRWRVFEKDLSKYLVSEAFPQKQSVANKIHIV